MNFDELIGSNEKTKEPKKSTKKSAVIIPVPELIQTSIDSLLKAKKAAKVAASDIKKAEPSIIEHGIKMKDEKAFGGKFQKSYKFGTDKNHINLITANKWSFKEGDVEIIKEIISDADGDAEKMIIQEKSVMLKAEVFKDPKLQEKFIKMVGKKFPEYFETVISHHVSEDFDEKIYDLGEGAHHDLKTFMNQSKPSLR